MHEREVFRRDEKESKAKVKIDDDDDNSEKNVRDKLTKWRLSSVFYSTNS